MPPCRQLLRPYEATWSSHALSAQRVYNAKLTASSLCVDPNAPHRCPTNLNILPQRAFRHILHRLEERPWTRKGVRLGDVRNLKISWVSGLLQGGVVEGYAFEVVFQKGIVVLEDAVPEILETWVVGRTGEEPLAGSKVCGQGESEACYTSDGRDGGSVVDVDARVCLEQLHSEEI